MPTWCNNYMEIAGSSEEIARFKETCIRVVNEGEHAPYDLLGPQGLDVLCRYIQGRDEPGRYLCAFSNAHSPPVRVWEKLGEMFPTLKFSLEGHNLEQDFAFRGTIEDGKLELREVPTIWETVDPKTGETVSGTQEEVDAVLGESGGNVSVRAGERTPSAS